MASRRSGGSHIVFHGPRAVSVRSTGSKTSTLAGPVGLARRLLFPNHPLSEPLPPVLVAGASNDLLAASQGDPALKSLNDELYDFMALAVRGFVLPWWSKITPRDKEFPQEITKIIVHLIRQVEARVLAADLPSLVAGTIPGLVAQHYVDYRSACAKLPSSYATGLHGSNSLPHLFHSLQPHMAISPEGVVDPNYIRQAVEHIMRACLPLEDWEAETERSIVREIVLKIILDSAIPRLSQPWFLHKSLLEVLGPPAEVAMPVGVLQRVLSVGSHHHF
jgi:PXA domain